MDGFDYNNPLSVSVPIRRLHAEVLELTAGLYDCAFTPEQAIIDSIMRYPHDVEEDFFHHHDYLVMQEVQRLVNTHFDIVFQNITRTINGVTVEYIDAETIILSVYYDEK